MPKRRKVRKGALALLIIIMLSIIAITAFLAVLTFRLFGRSRVRLTFDQSVTTVEVYSELDPYSLVLNSSGEVQYPLVDTSKLGKVTLQFIVTNADGYQRSFKYEIEVVDTTAPVIQVKDYLIVIDQDIPDIDAVLLGDATDNYDGIVQVTHQGEIKEEPGIYPVVYSAVDQSGNTAAVTVYYLNRLTPQNLKEPFRLEGLVIVNRKIPLPQDYDPERDKEATYNLNNLLSEAKKQGYDLAEKWAFLSYNATENIYNEAALTRTPQYLETHYPLAGYSDFQTGLAFQLTDKAEDSTKSEAYKWLIENCADYGFILRYPKGQESDYGYAYDPWHFRYVGLPLSQEITQRGLTLEQYLQLTVN